MDRTYKAENVNMCRWTVYRHEVRKSCALRTRRMCHPAGYAEKTAPIRRCGFNIEMFYCVFALTTMAYSIMINALKKYYCHH